MSELDSVRFTARPRETLPARILEACFNSEGTRTVAITIRTVAHPRRQVAMLLSSCDHPFSSFHLCNVSIHPSIINLRFLQ